MARYAKEPRPPDLGGKKKPTVLNARGTAREGDEKFFGMDIVPEKEMLMILTNKNNEENIRQAIQNLSCLSKPGSGIAFTCPADNFTVLGRK